jgi:Uma2 family endonuclease
MSAVATLPAASAAPAPPAPPALPRPFRWTCAEFHRAGEAGVFEGRRPVLIDGVILEQGPMNHPHAIAVELTMIALQAVFAIGWRVRVQLPLVIDLFTDLFPDFAVVAGSPRDLPGHPATAALVVEVSDTTLHFDTNEKLALYARAGVPEYWVLDLNSRRLLVFRDPHGTAYRFQQTYGETNVVSPLAAPTATIRVADLLP